MTWYCSNRPLGCCTATSRRSPVPPKGTFTTAVDGVVQNTLSPKRCTLDPQTCGFFISWQEESRRASGFAPQSPKP